MCGCCWLPLASGLFGTTSVGHNGVVAAMHIFDGGSAVVAISGVRTRGTGVVLIETKPMGPTIVHVEAIIGNNGSNLWWWSKGNRC